MNVKWLKECFVCVSVWVCNSPSICFCGCEVILLVNRCVFLVCAVWWWWVFGGFWFFSSYDGQFVLQLLQLETHWTIITTFTIPIRSYRKLSLKRRRLQKKNAIKFQREHFTLIIKTENQMWHVSTFKIKIFNKLHQSKGHSLNVSWIYNGHFILVACHRDGAQNK